MIRLRFEIEGERDQVLTAMVAAKHLDDVLITEELPDQVGLFIDDDQTVKLVLDGPECRRDGNGIVEAKYTLKVSARKNHEPD